MPENSEIFNLETDVIQNLNAFNQTYATFLRCQDSNSSMINQTNCPSVKITKDDVTSQYNTLTASIGRLSTAIDSIPIKTGSRDSSYNAILSTYADVKYQRKTLDSKLDDLYNTGDNISTFYKNRYNSTVYTNVLLTVLGTTILYYGFTKLKW
jgi:hypothetical protein